mgnify:CR=1 FL=1
MSHPHSPAPPADDDDRVVTRTEADEPSMTRFGPRPVPPGHRRPPGPAEARRIPPHGELSPDGSRPWPRPAGWARWLVWGGAGVAAAALTVATVEAGRLIADRLGDGPRRVPGRGRLRPAGPAPFAAPETGRRAEAGPDGRSPAPGPSRRPGPPPRRPDRPSLVQEVEATTASLSNSVENVMRSVGTAMTGFRGLAAEASDIVRELGDTAALLRGILSPEPPARGPRPTRPAGTSAEPQDERTHRL